MKIGRNAPCPCDSGRKFKHCHGKFGDTRYTPLESLTDLRERHLAREHIRRAQQGLGKPIIAARFQDNQLVAVGKTLHWSPHWKTFPDFLSDYFKRKLGGDWGNAEIAKPLQERHPLLQWYDAYCKYQKQQIATPGLPTSSPVTGVVACYLGVAYGLYLLDHNVELQERLLRRLKNPGNFQGAYYELQVASVLILAGFELTLEDECDPATKHCEFAAVSPETRTKFWVEAKMRAVAGQLSRTEADGSTSANPLSRLIPHLNAAFTKPAADERMIFIDLNAEMSSNVSEENRPAFIKKVTERLEKYERDELKAGESAYVFVTNSTFHRDLDGKAQMVSLPFGLGKPDFNRSGMYRLSDRHRADQKHADAYRVADGFSKLLSFPATFDGSLPATTLHGERPPVVIGESYIFEAAGNNGEDLVGEVTDAIVMEEEKTVMVAIYCKDRKSYLLKEKMTDQQLADYKAYPDAYFGKIKRVSKGIKTPQDLFKFFMEAYTELPREELLQRLGQSGVDAEAMSREELLADYCERLVSASGAFEIRGGVISPEPRR